MKRKRKNTTMPKRRFTLIELLVVTDRFSGDVLKSIKV